MHPSIEFWLSEVHSESEYAKKVSALTDQALSGTGLAKTDVERIVVTDHARYAEAIDVLGGKTGFTRTANYTGVGKAIPIILHGKFVGTPGNGTRLLEHRTLDFGPQPFCQTKGAAMRVHSRICLTSPLGDSRFERH
jgi:hypothetical protein